MSKSWFDFSGKIKENADRLWKTPVEINIDDLIFSKTSFKEDLIKKYIWMTWVPPAILVIRTNNWIKIVDWNHRAYSQKQKWKTKILAYLK